jgi:hypothetical protein
VKIKSEHVAALRERVAPLDTAANRERYRTGDFPRAELVKDLDMRYRWDLCHAGTAGTDVMRVMYAYANSSHVDTALRSIVPPLATP